MSIACSAPAGGNVVTITIQGRFDFSLHKQFRDAYRNEPPEKAYLVDLSATEYLDSSALGMLLLLREHAGGDQANIRIRGCQPDVKKILTISNFHKLFHLE